MEGYRIVSIEKKDTSYSYEIIEIGDNFFRDEKVTKIEKLGNSFLVFTSTYCIQYNEERVVKVIYKKIKKD